MYQVGIWFVHLMNVAILAIIGVVVLIAIYVKRGHYMRDATRCIQAEILLSTGWPEYHTVRCGASDEWVTIKGYAYKLDPTKRGWGLHPRIPFLGLTALQVAIRKETWYKDNPNPVHRDKEVPEVTAAEIHAKTREATAIAAGAQIVEMDARQKQLVNAIANQPNKVYVYLGLGVMTLGMVILIVKSLL